MRPSTLFGLLLFVQSNGSAQLTLEAIPTAVQLSKGAVVPVFCWKATRKSDSLTYGTGFLIGTSEKYVVVTCEHVPAIKDSHERTIGYRPRIWTMLNRIDGSVLRVNLQVSYADTGSDFSILTTIKGKPNRLIDENVKYKIITPFQCLSRDSLQEGDPLLYIGYPLNKGFGQQNRPLSRLGMVAQLDPRLPYYLMDGFVQGGSSGSPVFAVRAAGGSVSRFLAGICRGYPKELSDVVTWTAYTKDPRRKTITNPGFTVVVPVDPILRVLRERFTF
jgi:hypothetical protein